MHGEVPKAVLTKTRSSKRRIFVIGLIVITVAAALVYHFSGSTQTQRKPAGAAVLPPTDRCRCWPPT